MKYPIILIVLNSLAVSGLLAGSHLQLPEAESYFKNAGTGSARAAEAKAIKDFSHLNHPWKPEQPLPTDFAEVGLGADAKMVLMSLYFDGGSWVFALKDDQGRYLVFCTTKPRMQAGRDGEKNYEERFYLGATHWTHKNGTIVPRGSRAEEFLLKAVGGRIVEDK